MVKITGTQKIASIVHSDGRLGKQVTIFSRHTKTLVGKFGTITDTKIGGF